MSDHLYELATITTYLSQIPLSLSDVAAAAHSGGTGGGGGGGTGGVSTSAPGLDGPHHPGLAAGGQQCHLQGPGPGLRCEARQTVRCRLEGLVSRAEQGGRVDPGGPRGAVRDSRRDDPGEGQERRQGLGDSLPHLLQWGRLQVGVGQGYLRR